MLDGRLVFGGMCWGKPVARGGARKSVCWCWVLGARLGELMQLWDDGECRPTGPSGPGILHLISNSECGFPKRELASSWVSIIPDTLFIEHLLCAQTARCPGRSRVQDRQGSCLQIPPPALGWALASLDEQHTGTPAAPNPSALQCPWGAGILRPKWGGCHTDNHVGRLVHGRIAWKEGMEPGEAFRMQGGTSWGHPDASRMVPPHLPPLSDPFPRPLLLGLSFLTPSFFFY